MGERAKQLGAADPTEKPPEKASTPAARPKATLNLPSQPHHNQSALAKVAAGTAKLAAGTAKVEPQEKVVFFFLHYYY